MQTAYLAHDAEYQRRRAAGYSGWDTPESFQQTLDALKDAFALAHIDIGGQGRRLLEFGCGAGDLLLHFAANDWQVAGVDISPFAIAWAKEKLAGANLPADLLVADLAQELPQPLPLADLLLDGHCLHCIIGPDRPVFLRNAFKCLKPAGSLLIHTMCGTPRHASARTSFDPITRCIVRNDTALRYFGEPDSILNELCTAGFTIVAARVSPARDEADEDCLTAIAAPTSQRQP